MSETEYEMERAYEFCTGQMEVWLRYLSDEIAVGIDGGDLSMGNAIGYLRRVYREYHRRKRFTCNGKEMNVGPNPYYEELRMMNKKMKQQETEH